MTPFKTIDVRKCSFCGTTDLRKNLCTVTSNTLERNKWGNLLGSAFIANIENQKQPYICYSHFPPSKKANPRRKILPYLEGVAPAKSARSSSNLLNEDKEDYSIASSESDDEEYDVERDVESSNSDISSSFQFSRLLCDWDAILPFVGRCENCLKTGLKVEGTPTIRCQGAAVLASFCCRICENQWNWSSSAVIDKGREPGRKVYQINVDLPGSIVFSGNGFSEVQSFSQLMDIPFPSESMYYRALKTLVNPVVDQYFKIHQEMVMQKMVQSINSGAALNLAGDGQFDSRGYSAFLCRFSLICQRTGLLIDFEVMRKERGESSVLMEKVGHEISLTRVLEKLESLAEPGKKLVESFTSDRCNNMAIVMQKFPNIVHKYDNWHYIRSIRKDVTEKFTRVYFQPMIPWIRSLFAHIRTSIARAQGDGVLAWEMIFSFFHHVHGIHENFEPIEGCSFDVYKSCGHDSGTVSDKMLLDPNNSVHKRAVDAVKSVLLKGNRKQDLCSVDPVFSTNSVEAFHSIATRYTTKEKFYDKTSYEMRSKLSVLHWNCLKLEDEEGMRPVVRKVPVYCKTKKVVLWKNRKATSSHQWRYRLIEELRKKAASQDDYAMSEVDIYPENDNNDDIEADEIDEEEVRVRTEVERILYQF